MADQVITKQELEAAKIDVKHAGEAVNTKKVITPRYGAAFKSLPLVSAEAQTKADEIVAQGFYKGYATEALLLAAKPTVSEMRARADDTRKIYRWNRTSAEGITPVTGTWTDTGLSELDQAKAYNKETAQGALKQAEAQGGEASLLFSNRRGIPTWMQVDDEGMPTAFTKGVIADFLNNRLLHKNQNGTGFIVSDRRGVAVFDTENYSQAVSQKYDLTTVKFHGSSTMRFMQNELFTKLKNQFHKIQAALYTNKNSGGTINDLATEIGINDGLIKFTDDKIYAAAPSPVIGAGLKYGLPTTYDIPISLTNGIKGTLKSSGFIAEGLISDFALPTNLEIAFKSDVTDRANCVAVVNLGKNNMSGSNAAVVAAIVNMTRDAVSFLDKENGTHTLVIGHTTNRGSTTDFVKNVKDVNAQLKALYFKRYFGLFDYIFSEQIWIDTGLTKSSDDISAIAAETLPPSLTDDGIHLNAAANSVVTTQIVQFIQTLGWY